MNTEDLELEKARKRFQAQQLLKNAKRIASINANQKANAVLRASKPAVRARKAKRKAQRAARKKNR